MNLETVLKADADMLWQRVGEGCQESYLVLEGLKTYINYLGFTWVPPDTDSESSEVICWCGETDPNAQADCCNKVCGIPI